MTTNGFCTVVRTDEETGERAAIAVYPCMRQETEAYEVKKYGAENADKAAVYIPNVNADVKKGDYLYFGELASGTAIDDETAFGLLAVTSVTRCDYGSPDMQHVKAGAR